MLQQAAIDAVRQRAYTPYLQDGRPFEVETDNVVFYGAERGLLTALCDNPVGSKGTRQK
jgi:hypothetical protein